MEEQLQASNVSGVWRALKTISVRKSPKPVRTRIGQMISTSFLIGLIRCWPLPPTSLAQQALLLPPIVDLHHPMTLTTDSQHQTTALSVNHPPPTPSLPPPPGSCLSVTAVQVRNQLRKMKVKDATGPDNICSWLLRTCSACVKPEPEAGQSPIIVENILPGPGAQDPLLKKLNGYRPVAQGGQ